MIEHRQDTGLLSYPWIGSQAPAKNVVPGGLAVTANVITIRRGALNLTIFQENGNGNQMPLAGALEKGRP